MNHRPQRVLGKTTEEASPFGAEYAAIVQREWRFVRAVARRIGVPERYRDDIALEVFVRFERHAATITNPVIVRAWLRTTTVYVSHEHFEARATRYERLTGADRLKIDGQVASAEEQFLRKESWQRLVAYVDTLEPRRRAVFRAYAIEGRTIAQIAWEMDIPEATAYNRLRLARRDLTDALRRADLIEARKLRVRGLVLFPLVFALRADLALRLLDLAAQLAGPIGQVLGAARRVLVAGLLLLLAGAALSDSCLARVARSSDAPSAAPPEKTGARPLSP